MGSLKSPCATSYKSLIDTIALDCLVFEKMAFFCILATNRQTNKQMDSTDPLSRSRSRERRLNNTLATYGVLISLYYSNIRILFGGFSADKYSAANSATGGGLGIPRGIKISLTSSCIRRPHKTLTAVDIRTLLKLVASSVLSAAGGDDYRRRPTAGGIGACGIRN